MHSDKLVLHVPLSTFKRTVRRCYGPAAEQSEALSTWYKTFVEDGSTFVQDGKAMVYGGKEGLEKFKAVWFNQLQLVNTGMLSGACSLLH